MLTTAADEMSGENYAMLAAEMAAQRAALVMLIAGLHGSLQTRAHRSSLRRPIPPAPQRALRDLTRQRTHLIQERASVVNRMQKVLE